MPIVWVQSTTSPQRAQMAALLLAAFSHAPSAWSDLAQAEAEVQSFLSERDRLALAALDTGSSSPAEAMVRGWIGAIRHSRNAWELHPLVVDVAHRGRGIGTALVRALESIARASGVVTLWLGTDDDFGGTTLFGNDLYPDVLANLARMAPSSASAHRHPYTFYRRLGYAVVGVLPDADGAGKHDILMARRVSGGW